MTGLDQIIEELTECAMRQFVKILMQAAEIFRFAVCDALPRRWDAFDAVRGLATQCATEQPVTTLDFVASDGWWKGKTSACFLSMGTGRWEKRPATCESIHRW